MRPVSREYSRRVIVIVFISLVAWWPLLNLIELARNPYLLGLLKFFFYIDNFGVLLSLYSFRACALGHEPDVNELAKLSLTLLLVLITMELPIIIASI